MLANTSQHPFSTLSSLIGNQPARFGLLEMGLVVWLTIIIAFPIIIFRIVEPEILTPLYIEPKSHWLVELFCGFVASLIAFLIGAVAVRLHERSLGLIAGAFLAMAIFDTIHAFIDPVSANEAFVASHTISSIAGAVLITMGLAQQVIRSYGLTLRDAKWIMLGLVFMFVVSGVYRLLLPALSSDEHFEFYRFSFLAHFTHDIVALLYGISALLLYKLYRESGQVLILVVGSFLVLFAQSAFLFRFSNMWDFTWWLWHGVKVLFYLGVLVSLAVGFLLALDTTQRYNRMILRANTRIQRSKRKLFKANRDLQTRNSMLFEAIEALDVPHVISVVAQAMRSQVQFEACELVLWVPEDRVAEFAHSKRFSESSLRIRVEAEYVALPTQGRSKKPMSNWSNATSGLREACLDLVAHGHRFGYLKFSGVTPEVLNSSKAELSALSSEAGPIIYNALLYFDWQQEGIFRTALMRLSAMLTCTLELSTVLEVVCQESTNLLEADGAIVWLPNKSDKSEFSIAASWFSKKSEGPFDQMDSWCKGGKLCTKLLNEINGLYQPRAWIIAPIGPVQAAAPNLNQNKAIALFPLVDESKLIGVMLLIRETEVPFSKITLSKGELLADQVRIAISNASSYNKLAEINQQLILAEATKIRNERLAVLGQMAASVAHEVRNPLSAITNCISVLKADYPMNGKSGTALEIIEDEVFRLDKLTQDFLTFGKPRTVVCHPVAVDDLLHKVRSAFQHFIKHEGLMIDVEMVMHNVTSELMLDANALEMILWNLLLNAAQAISERGLININLKMRSRYLFFAITDTGKGIASEDRKKIFEPFFSNRAHGAGLGLAIVLRFVQDWGGRIRVISVLGRGTTFLLKIPIPTPTSMLATAVEQQFSHENINS